MKLKLNNTKNSRVYFGGDAFTKHRAHLVYVLVFVSMLVFGGCTSGSQTESLRSKKSANAKTTNPSQALSDYEGDNNMYTAGSVILSQFKEDASTLSSELSLDEITTLSDSLSQDIREAGKLAVKTNIALAETGDLLPNPLFRANQAIYDSLQLRLAEQNFSTAKIKLILNLMTGATVKGAARLTTNSQFESTIEKQEMISVLHDTSSRLAGMYLQLVQLSDGLTEFLKGAGETLLEASKNASLAFVKEAASGVVYSGFATGSMIHSDGSVARSSDQHLSKKVTTVIAELFNAENDTQLDMETKEDFDVLSSLILVSSIIPGEEALSRAVEFVAQRAIVDYGAGPAEIEQSLVPLTNAFSVDLKSELVPPESFAEILAQETLFTELLAEGFITASEKNQFQTATAEIKIAIDNEDYDTDGDGVLNSKDDFPDNPAEISDSDNDNVGDLSDPDDDNDGYLDVNDAFPYDKEKAKPIVNLLPIGPLLGNSSDEFVYEITYDGITVSSLTKADITVNPGCTISLVPETEKYVLTLTNCTGDGNISVVITPGTAQTGVTLDAGASNSEIKLDNTAPLPTLTPSAEFLSYGNSARKFAFTLTLSEPVKEVGPEVIIMSGATDGCSKTMVPSGEPVAASLTEAASNYYESFNIEVMGCTGNGGLSFEIASSNFADMAENVATASVNSVSAASIIIDNTPPGAPTISPLNTLNYAPAGHPVKFTWNGGLGGSGDYKVKYGAEDYGPVISQSHIVESSLEPGSHTIYVSASDAAGNWSTPASYDFTAKVPLLLSVTTSGPSETFTIPYQGDIVTDHQYVVDWGDETSADFANQSDLTHTYLDAGTYNLVVIGTISHLTFAGNVSSAEKITRVDQLGQLDLTNLEGAFSGATNLTFFSAGSDPVQSAVQDVSAMFSGASSLTSVNLSGLSGSAVTSTVSLFEGTTVLSNIDLRDFDASSVVNMQHMFKNTGASQIIFPVPEAGGTAGFTSSVLADMSGMFHGANAVTELNLSGFNTSGVTSMVGVFMNASALTSLNISSFNTAAVTDMSEMFYGGNYMLDFPSLTNFSTSSVTSMSSMFKLYQKDFLDLTSFDFSSVGNMDYLFNGSNLTSVFLGSWDTSSVTSSIDYAPLVGSDALDCEGFTCAVLP